MLQCLHPQLFKQSMPAVLHGWGRNAEGRNPRAKRATAEAREKDEAWTSKPMERMLEASCTGNLPLPQWELNSAIENTKLALTDTSSILSGELTGI